ncbi:MAG: hypothetical protein M9905_02655 [Rhizobiaceae bacterium]|nr:hypothetical protein [Rhizobiaceae bacterium]
MALLFVVIAAAVLLLVFGFEMFLVLGVPALMIKEFFYGALPDPVVAQKILAASTTRRCSPFRSSSSPPN